MEFEELIDTIEDEDLKEALQLLWEEKADLSHQHSASQIRDFNEAVSALLQKLKPKDGLNGKDGQNGKNGKDGRDGRNGRDGRDAIAVDGKDGKDGIDGSNGQGFRWRGRWVKDEVYLPYDVVEFYGSSYIALKRNSNPPILSTEEWDLMASAGSQGSTGSQGPQGPQGEGADLIARLVFGATPSPAPNGVQLVFTTPEPYLATTLQVWRGSLRMYPTIDVAETDPTAGTFTLTVAPEVNEPLLVGYIKA